MFHETKVFVYPLQESAGDIEDIIISDIKILSCMTNKN